MRRAVLTTSRATLLGLPLATPTEPSCLLHGVSSDLPRPGHDYGSSYLAVASAPVDARDTPPSKLESQRRQSNAGVVEHDGPVRREVGNGGHQ